MNIDEWSFNKEINWWDSCIPKDCTSAIINQTIVGSVNIIAVFCSNRDFLCSLYHNEVFWDFIKLLKYSLSKLKIDLNFLTIFILDNVSYHRFAQTVDWLKYHEIYVEFLPPYCPTFAPMETLFKYIKSDVREIGTENTINFNEECEVEVIKEPCLRITDKAWQQAWISFVKEDANSIETMNDAK